MVNEQDSKLKFQLLLQQINMIEDIYMPFFTDAEMTRMTVHKSDRVWRFSLKLQNILPFRVFQDFQMRLDAAFSRIASVFVDIETVHQDLSQQLISDYWLKIVEDVEEMSPPLREELAKQFPQWNGQKLMLNCQQDFQMRTLKTKYAEVISNAYKQFGFPYMAVDFQLKEITEDLAAQQQAFLEQ